MLGAGKHLADVAGEADRHQCVAPAPHEQARGLEIAQPGPEPVGTVGRLHVDVARGGVEGGAPARGQIRAQELVDPGRRPLVLRSRHDPAHDALDHRPRRGLDQTEFGGHHAQQRRPGARAQPGQRRGQQGEAVHAVGVQQAGLDGHAPAHAVADQVRALDLQRVEQRRDRPGKEGGVIGGPDRLDRVAEPGEVDGDRAVRASQGADRGQKRGLGGAETVDEDDRISATSFGHRDAADRRADVMDAQPAEGAGRGGGGEEADPEMQIAADADVAGAKRRQAAVAHGRRPDLRVRAQDRVRAFPIGGDESRLPVFDEHVAEGLMAAAHVDPGPAPPDVEDAGVKALDQGLERSPSRPVAVRRAAVRHPCRACRQRTGDYGRALPWAQAVRPWLASPRGRTLQRPRPARRRRSGRRRRPGPRDARHARRRE